MNLLNVTELFLSSTRRVMISFLLFVMCTENKPTAGSLVLRAGPLFRMTPTFVCACVDYAQEHCQACRNDQSEMEMARKIQSRMGWDVSWVKANAREFLEVDHECLTLFSDDKWFILILDNTTLAVSPGYINGLICLFSCLLSHFWSNSCIWALRIVIVYHNRNQSGRSCYIYRGVQIQLFKHN